MWFVSEPSPKKPNKFKRKTGYPQASLLNFFLLMPYNVSKISGSTRQKYGRSEIIIYNKNGICLVLELQIQRRGRDGKTWKRYVTRINGTLSCAFLKIYTPAVRSYQAFV